jgi:phenylacetate-coenzyme A ligase PaaK-like adenylate-forming protein
VAAPLRPRLLGVEGVAIDVELVPAGALARSEGKAARVIDRRRG